MNRKIKFRAWDKAYSLMNYKVQVGNTDYADPNYTCNSIWVDSGDFKTIGWMNADDKCIDLMQFTGLKDKNGKEIYEGDLLTCLNAHDDYQSDVFKVTFEDGCFCLRILNTDTFATAISLRENISNSLISTDSEPIYNVIGNVFENPELLQE